MCRVVVSILKQLGPNTHVWSDKRRDVPLTGPINLLYYSPICHSPIVEQSSFNGKIASHL